MEILLNNQDVFFHELVGRELNWLRLETFKNWGLTIFSFHIGYAGEYHKIHAAVCLVFLAQCSFVFLWRLFDRPSIWNTVSLKKISPIGKIWSLEKHRTKGIFRKNWIKFCIAVIIYISIFLRLSLELVFETRLVFQVRLRLMTHKVTQLRPHLGSGRPRAESCRCHVLSFLALSCLFLASCASVSSLVEDG